MTRLSSNPNIVFPVAALLSGVGSSLSVVGGSPLAIVLPGVFFGAALAFAAHRSIQPLDWARFGALVVLSTLAWWLAILATFVSMRLPKTGNGIPSGSVVGAFAGATGAFVLAASLVGLVRNLRSIVIVCAVTLSGAVCGALLVSVGIYVSDYTAMGHPLDDIVVFPLWQMGVASTIPACRPFLDAP